MIIAAGAITFSGKPPAIACAIGTVPAMPKSASPVPTAVRMCAADAGISSSTFKPAFSKARPAGRQKFTREYKIEAVRLSGNGTKSVATAAQELVLRADQLYRWWRQFEQGGVTAAARAQARD